MPLAADFRVIKDLVDLLEVERPLQFHFDTPINQARGGGQPQSYLLVKYFLEGASALTWELTLNGTRLFESSGSGSHLLVNMEAFDANLLLPGENQVELRVIRGFGVIRVADMVVHYHVTV